VGTSKRFEQGKGTPAPGQYNIDGVMGKDGPKFGIGTRLDDVHKNNNDKQTPGPGAYKQQKTSIMTSAPSYGMGPAPNVSKEKN
jgi:hypothetical protein